MHKLQCAEIWGGFEKEKAVVASPGVTASLFASSGRGAKGGDIYYLTLCNSSFITRMMIADIAGHGESVSKISQSLYTEVMPIDYCQRYYDCLNCHAHLRPKEEDCCVFCSYGSSRCPSKPNLSVSNDDVHP